MDGSAEIQVPQQPAVQTEQPAVQTEQPAVQTEQSTTQPSGEKPSQQKDKSAESQNPQQRFTNQLPEHIRKILFDENRQPRLPDKIDGITPGQQEVATLVLLEWIAQEGTLPPGLVDPEKNILTIEFATNPPKIEINGATAEIVKITGVKGNSFECTVKDNNGVESQQTIPASLVIDAQKKIVEESEETGIVKASALKKFLETAKKQLNPSGEQGEQPLPPADQLVRINQLITSLESQLTPNQEVFAEALRLVLPSQQPAIQDQINKIESLLADQNLSNEQKQELEEQKAALQQILAISQQQSEELITQWVEKVYSEEFSTEEIDKINDLLETGNIGSIQALLEEKDGDSEDTKKAKSRAARVIKGLKEKFPIIGGVFGILLLLMIFRASKQGGGGGGGVMG